MGFRPDTTEELTLSLKDCSSEPIEIDNIVKYGCALGAFGLSVPKESRSRSWLNCDMASNIIRILFSETKTLDQQEKRLEREQHILTCAWNMVADRGFLALKISDLAKAASVSVGTLYAHFESKEDLIIAMAVDAWQAKLAYIEQVSNLDLDALERVVAIPIALMLFDRENPPLFEAQQLAGVPSIWRKASAQRHQSMLNLCSGFETQLMPLVEAACEVGGFELTEQRQAGLDAIEYSQIALGVGNAYMSNIFLPESEREELQRRQRESMPRLVMAAFKGFGLRHADPLALHQRLTGLCEALSPRREFPDCRSGDVSRS